MNKTSGVACFNCHTVGHRRCECSSLKYGGMRETAAAKLMKVVSFERTRTIGLEYNRTIEQ